MMITLTVKHHISAGHRIPNLPGAGSKCSNLHGHTFGLEWTFQVSQLDATEFEFAEAKRALREWVDEHMDHGYLVAPNDELLIRFMEMNGFKHHLVAPAPTTEALASLLLDVARTHVAARCLSVRVVEGPNNEATVYA